MALRNVREDVGMLELNLSEDAIKRLNEVAAQHQKSAEEFAAQLVETYLDSLPTEPEITGEDDPWLGLVGLGHSGHTNTSSRMREVMDELTAPHHTWSLKDADPGAG